MTIRVFGTLPELPPFKYQLSFITHIHLEARATVCTIGDRVEERCVELFSKYWVESHFLMENNAYVYKEENLTAEDL